MNSIIPYFLSPYAQETPFLLQRKIKVFILACLYGLGVSIFILCLHWFGKGNPFLLVADLIQILTLFAILWLIRTKRVEWATYLFGISFVLMVTVSNLINDYFSIEPLHYLRLLETTLLLLLAIVITGFFTLQAYPIKMLIALSLVVVMLHYFVLIERHYGGIYTNESLLAVLVYATLLAFTGGLAIFSFTTNNSLIQLVEQESEKVKRLNQNLESKVAERTKQLESQNKELTKVNNELDQFVYRVSHDLRAPLASVLGLIAITKQEEDSSKIREYLALQEKSVLKLDHFIQDIIHLSKNSRAEIASDRIDFQELIGDVFHEHSYTEQALKIEKVAEVTQSAPFFSDKERLRIVLGNLVSNAIRYSNLFQEKPFIKVQVRSDEFSTRIEVSDNGQGIAPEHIDKIFNMFYRASSQKVGTGLGLYIVKETVEKLHGTIQVNSQVGEGSCFVVEITRKAEELPA